jgi:hypothetical protein
MRAPHFCVHDTAADMDVRHQMLALERMIARRTTLGFAGSVLALQPIFNAKLKEQSKHTTQQQRM